MNEAREQKVIIYHPESGRVLLEDRLKVVDIEEVGIAPAIHQVGLVETQGGYVYVSRPKDNRTWRGYLLEAEPGDGVVSFSPALE
jgi:hypothetical protein